MRVNGDDTDNGEIEITTADTPLTVGFWNVLVPGLVWFSFDFDLAWSFVASNTPCLFLS